jgi:hypothetical protein
MVWPTIDWCKVTLKDKNLNSYLLFGKEVFTKIIRLLAK